MMTKGQMIERISEMNRSARAEFLAEFNEAELQQYLTNLEEVWNDFHHQFSVPADHASDGEAARLEPALMAG